MIKNRKAETRWHGIGFTSEIIGSNGNFDHSTPEPEPVRQILELMPPGASSAAVIECFDCPWVCDECCLPTKDYGLNAGRRGHFETLRVLCDLCFEQFEGGA